MHSAVLPADRDRGNRHVFWLITLLLLFGMGLIGSVSAAVWIEYYDGKRDAYHLMREGQRLPVAIYLDLQKGDTLKVDQPGISLTLKHDDGSTQLVTQRNSPYRIQETGQAPDLLDQLFALAGEFLSIGLEDGSARPMVITAGSRSGVGAAPPIPIDFPLAPSGHARLVAGHRPLHLFWIGGVPPIQLRLLRVGDSESLVALTLRDLTGNSARRLTLPSLPLKTGSYLLELRDKHRRTRINLDLVAADDLPRPINALGPSETDPTHANLYAIWLASQGDPWLLEAYHKANAIASVHQPARAFSYSLEAGRRPTASTIK